MDYKWNDDDDENGISNHVMDWQNERENNNKKCFADFAINFHPFNVTRLKIDPKISVYFFCIVWALFS